MKEKDDGDLQHGRDASATCNKADICEVTLAHGTRLLLSSLHSEYSVTFVDDPSGRTTEINL